MRWRRRVSDMKGAASFLLVLAFSLLFMAVLRFQARLFQPELQTRPLLLQEERMHALELEFKGAVRSALGASPGSEREEKAKDAASKLAQLEATLEKRWAEEGFSADVWAGVVSEADLRQLPSQLAASRLKCSSCRDWSAWTLDSRGKPAFFVQGFLDLVNGSVRVSRTGSSFLPELYAESFSPKQFVLGVSIYREGSSAVFLVPEGFS